MGNPLNIAVNSPINSYTTRLFENNFTSIDELDDYAHGNNGSYAGTFNVEVVPGSWPSASGVNRLKLTPNDTNESVYYFKHNYGSVLDVEQYLSLTVPNTVTSGGEEFIISVTNRIVSGSGPTFYMHAAKGWINRNGSDGVAYIGVWPFDDPNGGSRFGYDTSGVFDTSIPGGDLSANGPAISNFDSDVSQNLYLRFRTVNVGGINVVSLFASGDNVTWYQIFSYLDDVTDTAGEIGFALLTNGHTKPFYVNKHAAYEIDVSTEINEYLPHIHDFDVPTNLLEYHYFWHDKFSVRTMGSFGNYTDQIIESTVPSGGAGNGIQLQGGDTEFVGLLHFLDLENFGISVHYRPDTTGEDPDLVLNGRTTIENTGNWFYRESIRAYITFDDATEELTVKLGVGDATNLDPDNFLGTPTTESAISYAGHNDKIGFTLIGFGTTINLYMTLNDGNGYQLIATYTAASTSSGFLSWSFYSEIENADPQIAGLVIAEPTSATDTSWALTD